MAKASSEYCGAVIFLHGSGDTGGGVKGWVNSVDPSFLPSMAENKIKVIFPSATMRPYSMCGGEVMSVWHDRWTFGPSAKEDCEGVDQTKQTIVGLIEELKETDGISSEHIIVGGFSMGGGVSLCCGLSFNLPIAGVFSMSSWVSTESRLWSLLGERGQAEQGGGATTPLPPVLMTHGSRDGMIDIRWGEATRDALLSKGVDVQWLTELNLDHEPGIQSITMLDSWIQQRLLETK